MFGISAETDLAFGVFVCFFPDSVYHRMIAKFAVIGRSAENHKMKREVICLNNQIIWQGPAQKIPGRAKNPGVFR